MKSLRPVFDLIELAWWRWAAREMGPMHPDQPRAVLRIAELEARQ